MRLRHRAARPLGFALVIAIVLVCAGARADDAQPGKPMIRAVDTPGSYKSRNEKCGAVLTSADIGEYRVLSITRDGSVVQSINGTTGLLWLNDNRLIYSTSAIMGEGGIFVYDCKTAKTRVVNTHLQGDVFHLFGASAGDRPVIFFYVTSDILRPGEDGRATRSVSTAAASRSSSDRGARLIRGGPLI